MLCDICHKNIATVHLTEVTNDQVVEIHICQNCAQAKTEEVGGQLNISYFLGGLSGISKPQDESKEIKCPFCGLSFSGFQKKGRLGCGQCYKVFRVQIIPLIKKIHSSARHVGKTPLKESKKTISGNTLEEFKKSLIRAIQLEEYEEAARIRDKIKELEEKNQSYK